LSDPRARARRVAHRAMHGELAGAALEFAGFAYPGLDPAPSLAKLDAMAGLVGGRDHLALRRVVAIREGLGGNIDDYYDPRNSYLNEVLARRKGIPIALSVIWIEVGRRAGIEVEGVGLPGHFLVYAAGQLVDPFHGGEAIGGEEAAALVADAMGGAPRLNPEWLRPVSPPDIVRRMLRNLEGIYRERGSAPDLEWIATCFDELDLLDRPTGGG
jgi:hypothetical protein